MGVSLCSDSYWGGVVKRVSSITIFEFEFIIYLRLVGFPTLATPDASITSPAQIFTRYNLDKGYFHVNAKGIIAHNLALDY